MVLEDVGFTTYRTLSWCSPDRASGLMNDRSFPASRLLEKKRTQFKVQLWFLIVEFYIKNSIYSDTHGVFLYL